MTSKTVLEARGTVNNQPTAYIGTITRSESISTNIQVPAKRRLCYLTFADERSVLRPAKISISKTFRCLVRQLSMRGEYSCLPKSSMCKDSSGKNHKRMRAQFSWFPFTLVGRVNFPPHDRQQSSIFHFIVEICHINTTSWSRIMEFENSTKQRNRETRQRWLEDSYVVCRIS